jgi:DNA-binding NarL/FixJ family response regulator
VRILLVDDHTLVRRGLAQVVAICVESAEVTEAGNTEEAVELLASETYDVALIDIRMPGRDGLSLLREIRSSWPNLPVIMLSSYDDGEYVKAALGEGAAGYLLKDTTPEDLAQAILVALSGSGNVLSPRAIRNLFESPDHSDEAVPDERPIADAGLTRRELDVLRFLVLGHSNRQISRQLFLSEKTVKAHLAAVYRKLGVPNRTKAALAAAAMGIGTPHGLPSLPTQKLLSRGHEVAAGPGVDPDEPVHVRATVA